MPPRRNLQVLGALLSCVFVSSADAGRPRPAKQKLPGTVALTTASLPGSGPALVKKVKQASASRAVFRDRDGWRVHYALAMPRALPSSEITLKISDVSDPKQPKQPLFTRHKIIYSEAVVTRGQLLLTRDDVESPNARLLLEIVSDGELIAQQTFYIQGTQEAQTGSISFSEDEAAGDDDEELAVENRRR